MAWQGIKGHDAIVEMFRRALSRGRLATTYLFVGPMGVGKRTFAEALAKTLLCQTRPAADMDPCGHCPACEQLEAGTHPDVARAAVPKGKKVLPLDLLIGDREHRNQVGFCYDLSRKAFMGGWKIGLIDDADCLNEESANCLLKMLEEPPPKSVLILIGTNLQRQLPTIRSRCQIIRFAGLPSDVLAELLVQEGTVDSPLDAERIGRHGDGGLTQGIALAQPEIWEFRSQFLRRLSAGPLDSFRIAKAVSTLLDETTSDVPERRVRLTQVIEMALQFYRRVLRAAAIQDAAAGVAAEVDAELAAAANAASPHWEGRTEVLPRCIDRCLAAIQHIDRNAHPTNVVESWTEDLARLSATRL